MVGWLSGFYGKSAFLGYLTPNPFYTNIQFYLKQFSLAWVHSLIAKTFLFQSIQISQTILIQTIQFSISRVFVHTQLNVKTVLFQTIQFNASTVSMSKTVLFQTIQFCISTQFSSIWPIDRTLSSAITLGQSGPGSDDSEGLFHIPQSSSITGTSPSDCLVSYPGHSLWGGGITTLQRCSRYILQPQPTG